MRVSLKLNMFFHDHRSFAKIFVNSKKMKCIKDVESHITYIFGIENFYLKCEGQYLPPIEDVQILNEGDVVWVIPCDETGSCRESFSNDKNHEDAIEEQTPVIKKKKKSKRKCHEVKEVAEIEDITPKRKKKKKRDDTPLNCKKADGKKLQEIEMIPEKEEKESSDDSDDDVSKKGDKSIVKTLVHNFEKKGAIYGIMDNEKRVNIVKTIILSNENSAVPQPVNEPSKLNTEETPLNSTDTSLQGNSDQNIVSSNMETPPVNIEQQNTKRKRKRVRKRKNVKNAEPVTIPPMPISNGFYATPKFQINNSLVEQAPLHVRFNEDEYFNKINDVQKSEESNNDVTKLDINLSDEKIVKCLMSHPITPNLEPRVGDVIAFKILRISESYTPEVSSCVVGKVVKYDAAYKEITFDIVYGQDQCATPKGKFSLESDVEEQESDKFQCVWTSLLEPRLIYP